MGKVTTKATSYATASAGDIVLRDKTTIRLIFRPTLVNNPHDKKAAVSGIFLYQRKGLKEEWVDYETIPLSSVKKGDGYKLELRTQELLDLYNQLGDLYELHRKVGVPRGKKEFVELDTDLKKLIQLPREQMNEMLNADKELGGEFVTHLVTWALSEREPRELIKRLSESAPDSLRILNTSASLERLNRAVEEWRQHRQSKNEPRTTVAESTHKTCLCT